MQCCAIPAKTYRDAAIKLELAEIVGRRAASGKAKIFNTGDRLWVTSIEVKDKPEF
jgi:hypothetical protein